VATDVYVGRMRSVPTHVVLSLFTAGLYFFAWHFMMNRELRRHRGRGTSPVLLLILFVVLPVVGWVLTLLWTGLALRKVQAEVDAERRTNAFHAAVWGLVPVLGWAIGAGLLQLGSNRAWDRMHRELERATGGPLTVECPECTHRSEIRYLPFHPNPLVCPQCGHAGEVF
jgi:hypothetical protein